MGIYLVEKCTRCHQERKINDLGLCRPCHAESKPATIPPKGPPRREPRRPKQHSNREMGRCGVCNSVVRLKEGRCPEHAGCPGRGQPAEPLPPQNEADNDAYPSTDQDGLISTGHGGLRVISGGLPGLGSNRRN